MNKQTATFAAGCFWGVEADFRDIPGVLDAEAGYAGGETENPSYREVCTGRTGHAEAVRVTFDADAVAYDTLLDTFWSLHDPTQVNRQGPDVGTQYRSAVFTTDDAQRAAAEASKARAQTRFSQPIATQILPEPPFFRAEDYHQRYLEKQGRRTCRI
ncbi:MAG: peptide-methionine (S)-S-oxide reductase MsrA [Candidatus Eremiobacteraeota bacterium]|nr:peptide-methionine (S)-S-oxide reductase MsrA [Candidatus Eremiobacteraeota bacterium]